MKQSRKMLGVTLIETMLVLGIVAAVMVVGFDQYTSYKNDADIQKLQANIDSIFLSMANYYRANCRQQYTSTGSPSTNKAKLDPINSPTNPFPVLTDSTNLLLSGNFLLSNEWPPPANSLIDITVGANGYIAQFNQTTTTRTPSGVFTTWDSGSTTNPVLPAGSETVGNVYIWRIQVAVKLTSNLVTKIATYKTRMGAACTSSLNGSTVDPCSANNPGSYLVWERLPTFSSPTVQQKNWLTMPMVKQFNQLYTNDDMYGASNASWSTASTTSTSSFGTNNNYLCGG